MNGPNTILPQLDFEDLDSPSVDCLVPELLGGRPCHLWLRATGGKHVRLLADDLARVSQLAVAIIVRSVSSCSELGRMLLFERVAACTSKLVLADTPPVDLVLRYLGMEAQAAPVHASLEGRVDG